jgi:hypothetical protein
VKKPKVIKPVSKITETDLQLCGIWVSVHEADHGSPWYEAADEDSFRPAFEDDKLDEVLILVSAVMTLARKDILPGAFYAEAITDGLEPLTGGCISSSQPFVFVGGKAYHFWGGSSGIPKMERDRFFRSLGATANEVFPITFESKVPTRHSKRGIVDGFYQIHPSSKLVVCETGSFDPVAPLALDTSGLDPLNPFRLSEITERFRGGEQLWAFQQATRLITEFPGRGEPWDLLSSLHELGGDMVEASRVAELGLEVAPQDDGLYMTVTRLGLRQEQFQKVLDYCILAQREIVPTPPNFFTRSELLFKKARALVGLKRFDEAIKILETYPKGFQAGPMNDPMSSRAKLLQVCRKGLKRADHNS